MVGEYNFYIWYYNNYNMVVGQFLLLPRKKTQTWKAIRGVCHWARPEVWDEFQDKFNIPVVVEFGDLG